MTNSGFVIKSSAFFPGIVPTVQNCIKEMQKMEKGELLGEGASEETPSSDEEDEEDDELIAMASLSVKEIKSKLERESNVTFLYIN